MKEERAPLGERKEDSEMGDVKRDRGVRVRRRRRQWMRRVREEGS